MVIDIGIQGYQTAALVVAAPSRRSVLNQGLNLPQPMVQICILSLQFLRVSGIEFRDFP